MVLGVGIGVVNMMEKGQMTTSKSTHFETFSSMVAQILVIPRFKKNRRG